jgi:hypothetical protein
MLDELFGADSPVNNAIKMMLKGVNPGPTAALVQKAGSIAAPSQTPDLASALARTAPAGVPAGSVERVIRGAAQGGGLEGVLQSLQEMGGILGLPQQTATAAFGTTPERVEQVGGDMAAKLGANRHLGEFAAGVLSDPTTYIGLGLAGRGANAAVKLGAQEANPFIQGLRRVDVLDKATSKNTEEAATNLVKLLQSGLAPVNDKLGRVFPDLPKWTEFAQKSKAMTEAVQWLEDRHGLDFRGAQSMWTSGGMSQLYDQLPTGLQAKVGLNDLDALMKNATQAGVTDFPEATAMWTQDFRQGLGIKADSKVVRLYNDFTNWWKRQALATPAYLLGNLKSGLFMGQLEGVPGQDVLKDILAHKGDIARGADYTIDDAAKLQAASGAPMPAGLTSDAHLSAAQTTGANKFTPGLIDVGLGAGIGAASDQDNPLQGALVGAGAGAALVPLAASVRRASQGIETAMRQRAYVKGTSDQLVDSLAAMDDALRTALAQPRATGSIPSPNFKQALDQVIQQNGGQVSASLTDDLVQRMQNSVRATPDVVNGLRRSLDDILHNASQAGVDLSHKVHFDYQDLSNVERATKQVFPFATWFMKAMPFFAEHVGETPALAKVPIEWNQEAHENRTENGLTGRVEGSLPNPIGTMLRKALTGQQGEVYQNPLEQVIPFAGASRGLSGLDFSSNPADAALSVLDALGLGIHPALDFATRVSGIRGTDAPAEGIGLRGAGLVEGLTGVDLNAAGRNLEAGLRKNLSGKEPTNLNETAVLKRLDELALQKTGKAIGSGDPAVAPYIRAKAQQSGPLWDAAQQQIKTERGSSAVAGFIDQGLRPGTVVTPEESQIRAASTTSTLDQEVSQAIQSAAKSKPKADAPLEHTHAVLVAVDQILSDTGKEMPPEVAKRLADPTNENLAWISNQIYLHEVDQNPLKAGYRGSGPPEQRRLQNENAAYHTAGQMTDFTGVPNREVLKYALHTAPQNDQAMMRSASPELDAYLAWKTVNKAGTLEQFLAQRGR